MKQLQVGWKFILLDDEDYERVAAFRWNETPDGHYNMIKMLDGHKMKTFTLQRFVMQYGGKDEVAHLDGNPLNNQKANLKIMTHRENMQSCKNNTSGHAGVYLQTKQRKPWCANIWIDGKNKHIGSFLTKEEAVEARRKFVEAMQGLVP